MHTLFPVVMPATATESPQGSSGGGAVPEGGAGFQEILAMLTGPAHTPVPESGASAGEADALAEALAPSSDAVDPEGSAATAEESPTQGPDTLAWRVAIGRHTPPTIAGAPPSGMPATASEGAPAMAAASGAVAGSPAAPAPVVVDAAVAQAPAAALPLADGAPGANGAPTPPEAAVPSSGTAQALPVAALARSAVASVPAGPPPVVPVSPVAMDPADGADAATAAAARVVDGPKGSAPPAVSPTPASSPEAVGPMDEAVDPPVAASPARVLKASLTPLEADAEPVVREAAEGGLERAALSMPSKPVAPPQSGGAAAPAQPAVAATQIPRAEASAAPGGGAASTPDLPRHTDLGGQAVRSVRLLTGQDGHQSVKVRLVPESLGELRLEVERSGDTITVRLASASPAVREALESQARQIQHALQRDGVETVRVEVNASAAGSDTPQGRAHAEGGPHRGAPAPRPGPEPPSAAVPGSARGPRAARHAGQLNLFV